MKKFFPYISAILLALCIVFAFSNVTHAKQTLSEVQKERKEVQSKTSNAEKEVAEVMREINAIEEELNELNAVLAENEEVLQEIIEEKEYANKEIKDIENNIEERYNILKARAVSYQQSGGSVSYVEVLFGAKDFGDFISRVNAVNKIAESDANLMKSLELDKAKVEISKRHLAELEKEHLATEEKIKEHKEDKEEKIKKLQNSKKKLQENVTKYKVKDKELAEIEKKLKASMKPKVYNNVSVANKGPGGSGMFAWPTSGGYISSYMGTRNGRLHRGIDIARRDFSSRPPIYAAAGGTVEAAGYSGGYGNRVIINHHNGYKTLYAHMSSMSVSVGQSVSKGQTLGIMGSTGNSTGVHLHFEVTYNGNLLNPMQFFR